MSKYRIGQGDPPVSRDPGAGQWNSKPKQDIYRNLAKFIILHLPGAHFSIGKNATLHMARYFRNTGEDYWIDLKSMLVWVKGEREAWENELIIARQFVATLPPGKHNIASGQARSLYIEPNESKDWYFAVGGYSAWGQGVATVTINNGRRKNRLDFEYVMTDRYNWDGDKAVGASQAGSFGRIIIDEYKRQGFTSKVPDDIIVTDKFMGEFHRQGFAREYNMWGKHVKTVEWDG
jgi:hypothetical protein